MLKDDHEAERRLRNVALALFLFFLLAGALVVAIPAFAKEPSLSSALDSPVVFRRCELRLEEYAGILYPAYACKEVRQ